MPNSEHVNEPAPSDPSQGRVRRAQRRRDLPWVTLTLIAMCVMMAVAQRLQPQVTAELMFVPYFAETQPYRYLTMGFLHSDFWHLVFNMYALWLIGSFLERAIGRGRFLALYLLAIFGGSTAIMIIAQMMDQMSAGHLGASGGVFGLFAAYVILVRGFGRRDTGMLIVIGLNLVLSFVVPGISWQGHLGGLIAGAVLMTMWLQSRGQDKARRVVIDTASATILCGVLVALIAVV